MLAMWPDVPVLQHHDWLEEIERHNNTKVLRSNLCFEVSDKRKVNTKVEIQNTGIHYQKNQLGQQKLSPVVD